MDAVHSPEEVPKSILGRMWRRVVSITLALHQHDASQKSAAMAFDLFLGLLPLAAIAGWVLYYLAGPSDSNNSLIGGLVNVAPSPAADLVREQVRRLGEHGGTIAPLSIVGFIWIASAGAHTAMSSIQSARTGRTRAWPLNRLIAILVVIVLLVIITASTAAIVFSEAWLRHNVSAGQIAKSMATLARFGTFLISISLATLGTAAFFTIATFGMEDPKRRTLFPGAFAFASMWVLSSWAFSAYVTKIGRYSLFYGSLAAVALLLLWLWLSSFLLLIGSELNLQLEGTRKTIVPPTLRILRRRPVHRSSPPPPTVEKKKQA
ncbi:MAG: YihY/virulence factor BrkB family protein [Deltaproteobacteria bacterium]|nr:YihY/virulence factor BrkB family protein [Deltaproteobacteria bacterium]